MIGSGNVGAQRLARVIVSICFVVAFVGKLLADESTALDLGLSRINETDLKRHVSTLASDALEGREAGGRGGKAATAYLRSELKLFRGQNGLQSVQTQDFGREYQNLLVLLPGSDETLRREIVIVGAHYDHVGYGGPTNSHGPFGQIHNGADDNASGTSAVLELIKAFSSLPKAPGRSILFAFWDAEEVGLLGSKHWVAHPSLPLEDVRLVLNLDMLGRLRNGRVVTGGWRSAPGLRPFLASHNENNELLLAYQQRVTADSDHHPFYASGVPVIHFDTDKHEDYHRPSDDVDKINWDGLQLMTRFAFRLVLDAANRPELPRFRREALREGPPYWMSLQGTTGAPIRFGVGWDPDSAHRNVAQVAKITSDSPASSAGLQVGDRITRLGPWENGTFDDLKTVLQIVKNPVAIRVERPGAEHPLELSANFWGSAVRLGAGWIDDPAMPKCAVLTHVVSDSPADRAGMATGDLILEMGGRPIASAEDLRQRVLEESGPLRFRVERQGRIRDVSIDVLDEVPPKSDTGSNLSSGE